VITVDVAGLRAERQQSGHKNDRRQNGNFRRKSHVNSLSSMAVATAAASRAAWITLADRLDGLRLE
jgi:hypothetical protein